MSSVQFTGQSELSFWPRKAQLSVLHSRDSVRRSGSTITRLCKFITIMM